MANVVRVFVENPDDLLNAGMYGPGAVIQLQSGATEAGPFTDESTVALVAGQLSYTLYDSDGTASTWYRTRYENATETNVSDWSVAFLATSDDLCALEDAKQRLGIDVADASQDENLADWIEQASSWIRGRTHRRLSPDPASGEATFLRDGYDAIEGGRLLPMPQGVRTISLLEVAPYTGAAFVEIPASDYFLRPVAAERDPGWPATELWMTDIPSSANPSPYFPSGFANVRWTGEASWAVVPPEIENIALNCVVALARERGSSGGDRMTINIDGERIFERTLSFKDHQTLQRYTLREVQIV